MSNFCCSPASLRIFNLFSFIILVVVNILNTISPFSGDAIEDYTVSALQPSGPAFSIWGIIYLMMGLFIIYQLFPSTYGLDYINRGISPLFAFQAVLNISWLMANGFARQQRIIEVVIISLLLITTAIMYLRVQSIIKQELMHSFRNFFFGRAWISLYLSWLTGATCIDYFYAFADLSQQAYVNAAITLAALGVLALVILCAYRDALFGFTLVWTSVWIAVTRTYYVSNPYLSDPLFIGALTVTVVVGLASSVITFINTSFYYRAHRIKAPTDSVAK